MEPFVKTPYSRYPVSIREDHIEGIIDIDDVLRYVRDKKLGKKVKTLVSEKYAYGDELKF